jgi:hypothetical protein
MLEQDPPGFSFDEQYRVVSWKAYFETLKRIGKESAALKDNSGAQVFIRGLSRQALRDMSHMEQEINRLSGDEYGNVHLNLARLNNADLTKALKIFYSKDDPMQTKIDRYRLGRFDSFMDESLVPFLFDTFESNLSKDDDGNVYPPLDKIQSDAELYLGMWDTERMLGHRALFTPLLYQAPEPKSA